MTGASTAAHDRWEPFRGGLTELAPLLRRVVDLDRSGVARIRIGAATAGMFVRLPFGVLAARTIAVSAAAAEGQTRFDRTVRSVELLDWLDGARPDPPEPHDADWRGALPPEQGWRRIETVPDSAIREVVRSGALTLKQSADREGVPGAQPRAEVADVLLDSVVLTVTADAPPALTATITLRTLSALTRLGFLARDSHVNIDRCGRWTRAAAAYGSVYAEEPGGLGLSSR